MSYEDYPADDTGADHLDEIMEGRDESEFLPKDFDQRLVQTPRAKRAKKRSTEQPPIPSLVAGQAEIERDLSRLPILLPDVPHHVYHSDPWGPSLSQSTANALLSCPVKAWAHHPRLGGQARESSDAMDLGSVAHELMLGKGGGYVALDFPDYRTNAAKEARDQATKAGQIPILAHKLEEAKKAAYEVSAIVDGEMDALRAGETEVTILWREGEVLCRCRIDHLVIGDGWATITDLKWLRSADPVAFQRNAKTNGYDIQSAAYIRAVEAVHPELAGRVKFQFLLVEQGPPLIVQPVEMAGSMRTMGQGRWARAVKLWERCLKENYWPGYADGVALVEALPWQLSDDFSQAIKAQGDPTAGWGEEES